MTNFFHLLVSKYKCTQITKNALRHSRGCEPALSRDPSSCLGNVPSGKKVQCQNQRSSLTHPSSSPPHRPSWGDTWTSLGRRNGQRPEWQLKARIIMTLRYTHLHGCVKWLLSYIYTCQPSLYRVNSINRTSLLAWCVVLDDLPQSQHYISPQELELAKSRDWNKQH